MTSLHGPRPGVRIVSIRTSWKTPGGGRRRFVDLKGGRCRDRIHDSEKNEVQHGRGIIHVIDQGIVVRVWEAVAGRWELIEVGRWGVAGMALKDPGGRLVVRCWVLVAGPTRGPGRRCDRGGVLMTSGSVHRWGWGGRDGGVMVGSSGHRGAGHRRVALPRWWSGNRRKRQAMTPESGIHLWDKRNKKTKLVTKRCRYNHGIFGTLIYYNIFNVN